MTKSPMPLLMLALIWQETEDAHVFHADLPALVSNLQALCNNGRRGEERGREGESRRGEQKSMWHRAETRRGSFVRRFRLPENAKLEKIDSGLDHGVLTLTKTNVQETPRNVRHIDVA
ncbi:17.4 kDa class I heat shock protein-like [Citrus clementina]|nr:17.4 kDa class I heat shock protein-like [Citrus x clementina]